MNKLTIGLTGGIGAGKTLASDWFATQDIDVVDADVIAHQVVKPPSPLLTTLADTFGDWVLNADGTLNRPALRQHVFGNATALQTLNGIMHPAIQAQIRLALKNATSPYVILSAPLLLESDVLPTLCQRILVIDVPIATQIERASRRDGRTPDDISAIIDRQISRADRLKRADDVADNSQTPQHLYEQLTQLHANYLRLASQFNAS